MKQLFKILLLLISILFSNTIYSFSVSKSTSSIVEEIKLVRLDYQTPILTESQILLGFMNENATNGYDAGYDAVSVNNYPNQLYFDENPYHLIIQGVGFFDNTERFPLGIINQIDGLVKITVNSTEGFTTAQDIYIHDNVTNTYFNINNQIFEVYLTQGVHENRFSLTFNNSPTTVLSSDLFSNSDVSVFVNQSNTLEINILNSNFLAKGVVLYDISGKRVSSKEISNQISSIDVSSLSKGIYILSLQHENGVLTKKFII